MLPCRSRTKEGSPPRESRVKQMLGKTAGEHLGNVPATFGFMSVGPEAELHSGP